MTPLSAPVPAVDDEEVQTPALRRRLLSRRTPLSLALTAAIVGVAVARAPIDWHGAFSDIRGADLRLYAIAVAVFYGAFVLRSIRWQMLLRNTGEEVALVRGGEILMASFFVNCVVPAKMGDLYRALQVRSRERVSGGNALGSLIAERLIDLFTLMSLLLLAAAVTFHDSVPRALVPYLAAGVALCAVGVGVLAVMHTGRGQRLLAYLPEQMVERYERFRVGTIGAFGRWPEVVPLSLGIWGLEGARLGFVIAALGEASAVGPAHFLLVALVAALLTTVPFLPGGLGLVEGGIVVVIAQISSLDRGHALAIALLDRSISYGTLVLVGGGFFLLLHARPTRRTAAVVPGTGR